MTDLEQIINNIETCANNNSFKVTKNVERIAKAKLRFFGLDNWSKCPCYPPEDTIHGCGTEACNKMVENDGICHCRLYEK